VRSPHRGGSSGNGPGRGTRAHGRRLHGRHPERDGRRRSRAPLRRQRQIDVGPRARPPRAVRQRPQRTPRTVQDVARRTTEGGEDRPPRARRRCRRHRFRLRPRGAQLTDADRGGDRAARRSREHRSARRYDVRHSEDRGRERFVPDRRREGSCPCPARAERRRAAARAAGSILERLPVRRRGGGREELRGEGRPRGGRVRDRDAEARFPFTLSDVSLSGTPGHVFPGITPTFRPYAYATLQREGWRPLPPRDTDGYRALARLDPYEVSFDRAQAFYLLKLDFTVRSPDLPDLRYAFSPARLDLKRIELKDGTVLEPPAKDPGAKPSVFESTWSRIVRFESSPKDGAFATPLWILVDTKAKPEELQSLQGTLTVRFPKVLDTLRMSDLTVGRRLDAGGLTITVAARGRGSLTLRTDIDGDQIMYVRLLYGV